MNRQSIEAILAEEMGGSATDPRITGTPRNVGAMDELIWHLAGGDTDYAAELAEAGAVFTELDVLMARQWCAGRTLI